MDKEQVFLSLVRSGELGIDQDGQIWRLKKRGGNPNRNYAIRECQRKRLEYKQRDGYLLVTTTIGGVRTVTGAHRVVWAYFNGPIPPGMTINHKNGLKSDNRPINLELATYSENRIHAIEVLNVNRNRPKGSLNPKTKLTEADIVEMRRLRAGGLMVKEIALAFGINKKAASKICTGRTWTHI